MIECYINSDVLGKVMQAKCCCAQHGAALNSVRMMITLNFAHNRVKVTLKGIEHLADTCNAAVLASTSSTFDCRLTICQVPRKAVNKQGKANTNAAELLLLPWFCNRNVGSQT